MVGKLSVWMVLGSFLLFTLGGCGGGGGGGGGSASAEETTVAKLAALDRDFMDGSADDAEYAERLSAILSAVDARPEGPQKFFEYLGDHVVGAELFNAARLNATERSKTFAENIADIKTYDACDSLRAFIGSVGSNLLLADPVGMLLDFADPDIFLSILNVTVRSNIMVALVDNRISVEEQQELYSTMLQNPFRAHRDLLIMMNGSNPTPWLDTLAAVEYFGGETTVFEGTFTKTINTSGGGCTWREVVSGEILVTVTGKGTVSDPFEGSMDVTGQIVETLVSGSQCDAGGTYEITSFDGDVFGSDGKLWGEGVGVIGAGSFYAAINNATVSSSKVVGAFEFQVGDETLTWSSVTLNK